MIVRRVYLVPPASKASTETVHLQFMMRVLIDSGALYLVTAIAHFVMCFTPNSFAISVRTTAMRIMWI